VLLFWRLGGGFLGCRWSSFWLFGLLLVVVGRGLLLVVGGLGGLLLFLGLFCALGDYSYCCVEGGVAAEDEDYFVVGVLVGEGCVFGVDDY